MENVVADHQGYAGTAPVTIKIPISILAIKINFHLSAPSAQRSLGILTDDNLFKLLI